MKKFALAILAIFCFTVVFIGTGCNTATTVTTVAATTTAAETTSASGTTATAEASKLTPISELDGTGVTIGAYVNNLSDPFAELADGVKAMAKQLNATLLIGASQTGDDQAGQVNNMEDWIQRKVNAIIVAPVDPQGSIAVIDKAISKGIIVVTVADDSADSKRNVFISSDQYLGGRSQGSWIASALKGQGKIAIIEGPPSNSTNIQRMQGIKDVLKDYPNIVITRTLAANYDQAKAMQSAEDILTADTDINAIICITDAMALGAIQAVKQAGKLGKVKVIGFDGTFDGLESIANKELDGTVVTYQFDYGQLSVEWAVRLVKGEKVPNNRLIPSPIVFADQMLVDRIITAVKK